MALSVVALLSVLAFGLLTSLIRAQEGSAAVINISGRQRMLSQRTALYALRLTSASSSAERSALRSALRADLATMMQVHGSLLRGDGPSGPPSPALRRLYFSAPTSLDLQVKAHARRIQSLLETPDAALTPALPALKALLREAPVSLLSALNAAVTAYETEAEARIARLRALEAGVLVVTLLTLLLEAAIIFRPMERELQRRSQQLLHDAFHDPLTGLPNRALFMDRLGQAISRCERQPDARYAVLFLDCDRFKVINDSLGHPVGDALLVALAARLKDCVREGDTVARLGGDEFTVLLESVGEHGDAVRIAERIGRALSTPLDAGGQALHITASIGLISSEEASARPDEVLRDADLAMYRAKALGRARYEVFTRELRERAAALMGMERDLRGAEERGELAVHYQPVVALPGGEVTGFEALLRWTHGQLGAVSPGEFIPVAEESGLVVELDRFVLRAACTQVRAWQHELGWAPPLTLSVNLSGRHLQRPDLPEVVAAILAETGFPAAQLKLELTESVLASDTDEVRGALVALKALGVQLHIDDFGTGYSSLSYLHRFPADAIKIDRSFINNLTQSDEGAQLVKAIITMAHSLGLGVVAEGVETEEQRRMLHQLGCESSQGYLFSRPLPPQAARSFLAELLTRTPA